MCPSSTLGHMPDAEFDNPRLAAIYDPLDPDRSDLDVYAAIAGEFGAHSVLDVGCGTGTFACLLAGRGIDVVAVDPAAASLEVARGKPGADRITWIHGDATSLPPLEVDLATMTANVAQVFLTDSGFAAALRGIREALRPGGHLVFEIRDPQRRAWLDWTRASTHEITEISGVGIVETWIDVTKVDGEFVTFRSTNVFDEDGAEIVSDSTLRFRSKDEVTAHLRQAGYTVTDVRDAPDRPGREFVFIACRDDGNSDADASADA
ncbi:class I SAM-dependent methyltransferase [Spelaeicoccus albus]